MFHNEPDEKKKKNMHGNHRGSFQNLIAHAFSYFTGCRTECWVQQINMQLYLVKITNVFCLLALAGFWNSLYPKENRHNMLVKACPYKFPIEK